MLALKRLLLVIFVLAAPAGITAALYFGAIALLAATNRVIDPQILRIVTLTGLGVLFVLAVLEAKDRWS
jgi:hypothetical protein